MTNDDLKQFFNERPALSQSKIAEEAGIGRRTLVYYLQDDPNPVTEKIAKKLLPVLRKYGYQKKLKEMALELLEKYERAEENNIYEYSGSIENDSDNLKKEVEDYKKRIEAENYEQP